MFRLLDGRSQFYQWDIDRIIVVEDATIDQVHFCNRTDECSLVCEVYRLGNMRVVNVPNILLQTDWRINVYAYDSNYTKHCEVFDVIKRSKPADYVYTETEIMRWSDLDARIDQIEESGVSNEKIAAAVTAYLDANPIEAPVESVNGKTGAVELTAADVGALPNTTVIPDTTGLATEDYVDKAIMGIDIPSVDGLATEDYVDEAVKNVSVDLTGYATEKYVDDAIANLDIPEAEVDLSNYYTKEETDALIPDVSTYQTEAQVIALIEQYGGGTEELPAAEGVEF